MSTGAVVAILLLAALFEAGGDALIRAGLHNAQWRWLLMLGGAIALFGYGYTVNAPPWDFGRLLGVYIVLFFVVAQITAWLAFGQRPSGALLLGGAFIVAGGMIIASHT
jgi:drug/metabolite transporter superfamily protein YnfA